MRLFLSLLLSVFIAMPAGAQDALPDIPGPLQAMVDRGAQIRYLGKAHGLDGWITVYKGQEQYFYVLPGGEAFLMGLLFEEGGLPITIQQVQKLQEQGDDVLDLMAEMPMGEDAPARAGVNADKPFDIQKPVERMFADVQNSNWVALGQKEAPVIYSFIDPQCPHCHDFVQTLRKAGHIEQGRVQVRLIPVGFREDTLAQAAFLLASSDAEERFYKHLDGDETALPAKSDVNNQGIQKNMALMQAWKFDVTPFSLYRSKDGEVKLIRGVAKDVDAMLSDLQG